MPYKTHAILLVQKHSHRTPWPPQFRSEIICIMGFPIEGYTFTYYDAPRASQSSYELNVGFRHSWMYKGQLFTVSDGSLEDI